MQLPFVTSIDTWWTRFVLVSWLNILLAVLTCATADPFLDTGNSLKRDMEIMQTAYFRNQRTLKECFPFLVMTDGNKKVTTCCQRGKSLVYKNYGKVTKRMVQKLFFIKCELISAKAPHLNLSYIITMSQIAQIDILSVSVITTLCSLDVVIHHMVMSLQ